MITGNVSVNDGVGSYDFAINVNGTDYPFIVDVETGNTDAITSTTIALQLPATSTITLVNRDGGELTLGSAELNVVRLS